MWAGLFLLLAVLAVLASRGLWSGLVADLLGFGPDSAPQGTILWQTSCVPGTVSSVNSAGKVLLVSPAQGGDGAAAGPSTLAVAAEGAVTLVATISEAVLAAGYFDPALGTLPSGKSYGADDWRVATVRSDPPEDDGLLREEVGLTEPGTGPALVYSVADAVVTSACAWADDAELLLGLFRPGLKGEPKAEVMAVGPGSEALWSRELGPAAVHRLVARPGTGFVAAATPKTLALLDSRGNLLWSKTLRTPITDLGLQSRGGPVVISGGTLLVYDRRGNLIWRKRSRTPLLALDCSADRIAVAMATGVAVYDEDGLERWRLATATAPTEVDLDPDGELLSVVLGSGSLVVARAPGSGGLRGGDSDLGGQLGP